MALLISECYHLNMATTTHISRWQLLDNSHCAAVGCSQKADRSACINAAVYYPTETLWLYRHHILRDERVFPAVPWVTSARWGSPASGAASIPAASVQLDLQPVRPRPWTPVLSAADEVTQCASSLHLWLQWAESKQRLFWKPLGSAVSAEQCVVSSEAAWISLGCSTEAWLANSQYRQLFCHKKDFTDKISSVMPNYGSLEAGTKALIGCSVPVLAFWSLCCLL